MAEEIIRNVTFMNEIFAELLSRGTTCLQDDIRKSIKIRVKIYNFQHFLKNFFFMSSKIVIHSNIHTTKMYIPIRFCCIYQYSRDTVAIKFELVQQCPQHLNTK